MVSRQRAAPACPGPRCAPTCKLRSLERTADIFDASRALLLRAAAAAGRRSIPIDRTTGMYVRPEDEAEEPMRTERLLTCSLRLYNANAADTLDAIGFALMARSGGHSLAGVPPF